jgi:cbb3-type cytochrome oxidase subunit 3
MSPTLQAAAGWASGVMAALLIVCFVGLCAWVFDPRRRRALDMTSQLPLEEDRSAP